MSATPERVSKADFARHMGWTDTRVSQLAREHRLVLDNDGLVIVERSKALIAATRKSVTRGGDRCSARARLAAEQRAAERTEAAGNAPAPAEPGAPPSAGATQPDLGAVASLTLADVTRAEKIERTRNLRLQNAREAGALVRRDHVDAEAFRCARQAQELLLALRDRLPPLLAAMSDEREIGDLLDTELRHVIATIASAPVMADAEREAA